MTPSVSLGKSQSEKLNHERDATSQTLGWDTPNERGGLELNNPAALLRFVHWDSDPPFATWKDIHCDVPISSRSSPVETAPDNETSVFRNHQADSCSLRQPNTIIIITLHNITSQDNGTWGCQIRRHPGRRESGTS
jgi:hypothetical protein